MILGLDFIAINMSIEQNMKSLSTLIISRALLLFRFTHRQIEVHISVDVLNEATCEQSSSLVLFHRFLSPILLYYSLNWRGFDLNIIHT